jgi:uncharacterized membrane protein YcaP (DUF421 family)
MPAFKELKAQIVFYAILVLSTVFHVFQFLKSKFGSLRQFLTTEPLH